MIHPMIVHFPIALLIVGFIAELIAVFTKKEFFSKAGFYLLILGTAGVITAYFTGNAAGEGISETGMLKNALESHEEAAEVALIITGIAALFRIVIVFLKKDKGILKSAAMFLFLLGVLAIARTGYYGGELVYKHAAGVQINLTFENPAGGETKSDD